MSQFVYHSVINTQETKRDRRRLKEREAFILITVTNYTKVTCLQRIYDHSVQIAEFLVHPLIRPGLEIHIVFFLSQPRCQNPYFELDTEQDAMRKLFLIKRGGFHCIIFGTCLLDSYLSRLFKSWIALSTG